MNKQTVQWMGFVILAITGVALFFNAGNVVGVVAAVIMTFTAVCALLLTIGKHRQWKWATKLPLVLLVFVLLAATTSCSSSYDPIHYTYSNTVPQLIGIQMTTDAPSNMCAIGVVGVGAGFVATVAVPISGVVAWMAWTSVVTGVTGTIDACWDEFKANRSYFNVFTQCQGDPVLKTTLTDYNNIGPYVEFPSCVCGGSCIDHFGPYDSAWHTTVWLNGRNHVESVTGPPVAPPDADMQALAAKMGLSYAGSG